MESLQVGKFTFYPEGIVISKKKGNIVIKIENIEIISYNKPKVTDYLPILNLGATPKLFRIRLIEKINGKIEYVLAVEYEAA